MTQLTFLILFQGRQGRGSIFVWATGNGGESLDDCNCDGYSNSIYTIGITGAAKSGEMPTVNEACSAALAAASTRYNKTERVVVSLTSVINEKFLQGFKLIHFSTLLILTTMGVRTDLVVPVHQLHLLQEYLL